MPPLASLPRPTGEVGNFFCSGKICEPEVHGSLHMIQFSASPPQPQPAHPGAGRHFKTNKHAFLLSPPALITWPQAVNAVLFVCLFVCLFSIFPSPTSSWGWLALFFFKKKNIPSPPVLISWPSGCQHCFFNFFFPLVPPAGHGAEWCFFKNKIFVCGNGDPTSSVMWPGKKKSQTFTISRSFPQVR